MSLVLMTKDKIPITKQRKYPHCYLLGKMFSYSVIYGSKTKALALEVAGHDPFSFEI